MTSTVTPLIHSLDKSHIVKMFEKFKSRWGNMWSSRAKADLDWDFIIDDWFEELSKFTFVQVRNACRTILSMHEEFPPSLSQLITQCRKESGIPDKTQIIRMMVGRDFSHPITKMIFDKIGSWTISNRKESEIQFKVQEFYPGCVAEFSMNPKQCWDSLELFNAKPKELPIPDKIPSVAERKSFTARMEEYKNLTEQTKSAVGSLEIPDFDSSKIFKGGEQYQDYIKFLLVVPDHMVLSLPPRYAYDRQRILNKEDTAKHLRESGYIHSQQSEPRRSSGPAQVYKAWMND